MTSVRSPDLYAELKLLAPFPFQKRELQVGYSCELCHSKRPSRRWKVTFNILTNWHLHKSNTSDIDSTSYESWIWFDYWSSFEQLARRASLFSEGDAVTIFFNSKVLASGVIKQVRSI